MKKLFVILIAAVMMGACAMRPPAPMDAELAQLAGPKPTVDEARDIAINYMVKMGFASRSMHFWAKNTLVPYYAYEAQKSGPDLLRVGWLLEYAQGYGEGIAQRHRYAFLIKNGEVLGTWQGRYLDDYQPTLGMHEIWY